MLLCTFLYMHIGEHKCMFLLFIYSGMELSHEVCINSALVDTAKHRILLVTSSANLMLFLFIFFSLADIQQYCHEHLHFLDDKWSWIYLLPLQISSITIYVNFSHCCFFWWIDVFSVTIIKKAILNWWFIPFVSYLRNICQPQGINVYPYIFL